MNEPGQEIDADALLEQIESPTQVAEPAAASEPVAAQWNGEEWGFEANGKRVIPENRDKVMQWASQGYNYSQRMGELNKTHAQKLAELEERGKKYQGYDRFDEVNKYAQANPDWWKHVEESFQKRDIPRDLDPSLQPVLEPLLNRLQQTESVLGQWQQEKQQQEYERQDQALDSEIDQIRKEFPKIDLSSVDPASGETLELQVLKHAGQLGTKSFSAAFRDYFHPKLIEMARADALESAAKEKELNAKKGLLGKTQAPVKGMSAAQNVRGKSYDQLAQEALAEMGA